MCSVTGENASAGTSMGHKRSGHKVSWERFRIVGKCFGMREWAPSGYNVRLVFFSSQISARLKPDTVATKSLSIRKQSDDDPAPSLTTVNTTVASNNCCLSQSPMMATSQTQIISNCRHQSARSQMCSVCTAFHMDDKFHTIPCEHSFCKDCWSMHFETQINQGISTGIGCMATKCNVLVPEELVLKLLNRPQLRNKYQHFAFQDYVKSHPELRFCPGINCNWFWI